MVSATREYSRFVLASLVLMAGFTPAAQAAITSDATIQVLDQLDVFAAGSLKRSTEVPIRLEDLNSSGSAGLVSCQNGRNGLTCLDTQLIRNWPTPKKLLVPPTPLERDTGKVLFSCQDNAMGLLTNKAGGPCLSLTVDVKGDIWLAARKTSTTHNLIQLTRKTGACSSAAGWFALSGQVGNTVLPDSQSANYCFRVARTGRPLLLDISAFDGEFAAAFKGRGILGVENRKTVVFFPSSGGPVVEIGKGSNEWNLNGGEGVHSAALLQRELQPATPTTAAVVQTFGLITTSTGRVMWKDMAASVQAKQLADANATTAGVSSTGVTLLPRGPLCETAGAPNFFELRISDTTGGFFVSNRNYCTIFVASPTFNVNALASLTTIDPEYTPSTFKPDGLSVAPGIAVNLADCSGPLGCNYIPDGTDDVATQQVPAASMINVSLAPNSATGMIVFHIRNIPDCRRIPSAAECVAAGPGVMVTVPGKGTYLNVTPMLPQQIKDLFDTSGRKPTGLPAMLISPRYEAQPLNGFTFDALFGITDPAVVFRKSFTAQFDVGDGNLVGADLGCGVFQKDANGNPAPLPFHEWDILSVVSERFGNVGGPTGIVVDNELTPLVDETEHVDMLANKGCFNPTVGAGTRWSLYSFNLRLAEVDPAGVNYTQPRLYLGNLLKSLYMDLFDAQTKLACASVDAVGTTTSPATTPPLSSGVCMNLKSNWDGTQNKLFKCIDAAVDPKVSQLDQNCGAFDAQFPPYESYVRGLSPQAGADDPANRVGELTSRLDVIRHVFYNHFISAPVASTGTGP